MITPPAPSAPPAVGVKVNVAAVEILPASRWDAVIVNDESDGWPPITPEACTPDVIESMLVFTVTLPPAVAAPMVKPESTMVTEAGEAAMEPVASVTAMEVAPDVAVLKVSPSDAAEIVAVPETKKPSG